MLTNKERLDAVSHAAGQRGISYGKMVIRLGEQDLEKIYRNYEVLLEEKRLIEQERELRRAARKSKTKRAGKK